MPIPLVVIKRVRMSTGHIMVTTRYSNKQGSRSRGILARSNHPRTSETYRRQDDVFGYQLQLLLSDVLPCPSTCTEVIKNVSKKFPKLSRVTRRHIMRRFTRNGITDHCQSGSSNLLTRERAQPRSSRIVIAYPKPTLSATKRTNHANTVKINNIN